MLGLSSWTRSGTVFEFDTSAKCFFFQQAATQVEMVVFRFAGDLRFAQKRIREAIRFVDELVHRIGVERIANDEKPVFRESVSLRICESDKVHETNF